MNTIFGEKIASIHGMKIVGHLRNADRQFYILVCLYNLWFYQTYNVKCSQLS